MNKTISINLGGLFFHIDEFAYQTLNKYLEAISSSLNDEPNGKKEILADIEARISELLSEKIDDNRQVINEEDVQNIITIMGQPEDYAETDDNYTEKTQTNKNIKKLYRDGEDKFLGGVSSGIAQYIKVDPIWIRLGFFIAAIAGGFGLWTYTILWILIPEAKTTAEKLQMKGEPVNIDNIERKIRDEFENVSNSIKNADYSNLKTSFQKLLNLLGHIFSRFFTIIGKLVGVLLIIISFSVIVAIFIDSFSFHNIHINGITSSFHFLESSTLPHWLLITSKIIAFVIPFIMLFYLGITIISNSVKRMNKIVGLSLFGTWIIAIMVLIFVATEFQSKNAYQGSKVLEQELSMEKDTLYVKMVNNDDILFRNYLKRSDKKYNVLDNYLEKLYSSNIYLNIKRSETGGNYIKIRRKSEGIDHISASLSADFIDYNFEFLENDLILDSYFLSPKDSEFKDESINITLYITDDTTLFLNESSKKFIYKYKTTKKTKTWKLVNHYFLMTPKGLMCTDCNVFTNMGI